MDQTGADLSDEIVIKIYIFFKTLPIPGNPLHLFLQLFEFATDFTYGPPAACSPFLYHRRRKIFEIFESHEISANPHPVTFPDRNLPKFSTKCGTKAIRTNYIPIYIIIYMLLCSSSRIYINILSMNFSLNRNFAN